MIYQKMYWIKIAIYDVMGSNHQNLNGECNPDCWFIIRYVGIAKNDMGESISAGMSKL